MRSNRLQLNTAKTEVLWCATSRRQHQIPREPTRVGTDFVQSLVVSLVLSRLDYGNAVLASLPARELRRLQSVQNAGARAIFSANKYDHGSASVF